MHAGMRLLAYRPVTRDYPAPFRYGIALYVTVVALLIRAWIDPLLADHLPYLFCYVTIIASVWIGRVRPGILSFLLGGIFSTYYWVPERQSFHVEGVSGWLEIGTYVVGGLAILTLSKGYLTGLDVAERELEKRTQAEEALSQTQAHIHAIVDSGMVGVITADSRSVLEANDAFLRMTGYSRQDLEEGLIRWDALRVSEYAEVDDKASQELLRNGSCTPFEKEYFRKDGSRVPVMIGATLLQKEPPTWASFVLDMTERKRTQEQLKSSEERLRLAQAAAQAGSWDWDLVTNTQVWSDEFYSILGLENTVPPTYENWLFRIHPEDRDRVDDAVQKAIASNTGSFQIEYRAFGRNNEVRWIESRRHIYRNSEGSPVRMIGVSIDVTIRKNSDAVMLQTEKLASAGRMAATIAHEINNPLESVVNLVYLAKSDPAIAPQIARLLELAEAELDRVTHIAKQTLGFYRGSAAPHTVLVSSVLRSLSPLYAAKLDARNIRLKISTRSEHCVYANEGELRQVFANLVSNSLDAVGKDGAISIRVTRSVRWNSTRDHGVRITVADTGPGISAHQLPKIFDPFFTTKKDVGTGLGLWVTRNLVEKYRGSISVRTCTRRGKSGTAVSVFFPAMTPQQSAPEESGTAGHSRTAVA